MNKAKAKAKTTIAARVTLALVSVIIASMSVTISFINPVINVPFLCWTIALMFATIYLLYRQIKNMIDALNI